MMKNNAKRVHRVKSRLVSALLCLAMLLPALGAVAPERAAAATWMEPYLEKLVSWGVMRGDSSGNLHPDRTLTRGEFVVLVNRAFGYNKTGAKLPFKDVKASDWYYDDVNIGYTTGYFNGTSKNTASPKAAVTREQAAVLLGRNLMLESQPGASIEFSDSSSMSNYSRGLIRSAVSEGYVGGYKDGSFKPKRSITRGQMAVMLTKAVGTPLNKPGAQTLGGVYGNVTISSPGVVLRDTTIAGNLYITGGVGLGDVTLENVTVLGKIVIAGAGESSKGDNSVILRNVTAPRLVMDTLSNNMVSVRAEGDTKIDKTNIRTPSYLEDATDDEYGFLSILVDGEPETKLSVAGNLKEITTLSSKSTVTVAKGSVKKLTVDETAADSAVSILNGSLVHDLNLDVGTKVSGAGDVQNIHVNTPGSKVDMLPDNIVIRPGIDADIDGGKMDTVLGAESSADPILLAGYPKVTDTAPSSAVGVFRTNKQGTVYWAVTSITDGSVKEADLLKPSNNANIVKSGTVQAAKSATDYTAAISGLTTGGSYYLSAMLVDARDQRSLVKSTSFTTPDNTPPNFAAGYPYLSKLTSTAASVTVMPTKTCRLYYALLPKGATAPTASDFKSGAISGNLGFGSRDVTKNVTDTYRVNSKVLEEVKDYELYLWLTDVDGANSSAVKKISFTTLDGTPPKFVVDPTPVKLLQTSVNMNAVINEDGTIFWAAVKEGDEYPKPMNGQTVKPPLSSDAAKLQVSNGMNALTSGKITATANKEAAMNVTGLESEAAYDVYYVAQDKAGNFSSPVGKVTIHTLDTNAPSVTQEFTNTNDTEGKSPLANTDIRIVFSEGVQDSVTNQQLLKLAQATDEQSKTQLTALLRKNIQLWSADTAPFARVADEVTNPDNWTINYSMAQVTAEGGKIVVTFKNGPALKLLSGSSYFFEIHDIADNADAKNMLLPNPTRLPTFKTVYAEVNLTSVDNPGMVKNPNHTSDDSTTPENVLLDMAFRVTPASTKNAADAVKYDILFRTSSNVSFRLYGREKGGAWAPVKDSSVGPLNPSQDGNVTGVSYSSDFLNRDGSGAIAFPQLNKMEEMEYAILFTTYNGDSNPTNWSGKVEMEVSVVAGSDYNAMRDLASYGNISDGAMDTALKSGVVKVSIPAELKLTRPFVDTQTPLFNTGYPYIAPGDIYANLNVQLTRSGKVYYVVAPLGTVDTTLANGSTIKTIAEWTGLPNAEPNADGSGATEEADVYTQTPASTTVMAPAGLMGNQKVRSGNFNYTGTLNTILIRDLEPKTEYCAYFVLQGNNQTLFTADPYIVRFKTTDVSRPIITLDILNPAVNITVTGSTTDVNYLLTASGNEPSVLRETMSSNMDSSDNGYAEFVSGDYRDWTVLQAMNEDFKDAGVLKGSVFDEFAPQALKDRAANAIRQQSAGGGMTAFRGEEKGILDGGFRSVDCSPGLVNAGRYTFMAVGKSSVGGGSGDAFRAVWPVYKLDQDPPKVQDYGFEGTISPSGLCNGTLNIVFTEPLYTQDSSNPPKIIPVANNSKTPTDGTYVQASLALQASGSMELLGQSKVSQTPIGSVQYTLTNTRDGATITSGNNIMLCDRSGVLNAAPLSIHIHVAKDADGVYGLTCTINPTWDGTNS